MGAFASRTGTGPGDGRLCAGAGRSLAGASAQARNGPRDRGGPCARTSADLAVGLVLVWLLKGAAWWSVPALAAMCATAARVAQGKVESVPHAYWLCLRAKIR